MCHRTRDKALRVTALSRAGAPRGKTRPSGSHPRRVLGGTPGFRLWACRRRSSLFFPCAIESGLFKTWAEAFPDPRSAPEIGLEVSLPAPLAARFAGLYSMHKAGYVLRSARGLGGLGLQRGGDRPGAWLIAARHLG